MITTRVYCTKVEKDCIIIHGVTAYINYFFDNTNFGFIKNLYSTKAFLLHMLCVCSKLESYDVSDSRRVAANSKKTSVITLVKYPTCFVYN